MRYVIGALIILLVLLASIAVLGGTLFDFLDPASLLPFLLVMTAVIIMKGGFKTFITAVNALLSKKYTISAAEKEASVRLFKLLAKTVKYTAIIITLMGIINLFMGLNWRLWEELGSGEFLWAISINLAASLISIMYGLAINMIFLNPTIDILETRHNAESKTMISEKQVIDKLMELCYKQNITPEEILDANEITFKRKQ